MKVTREASTFYSMMALLKVVNHYAEYLCSSGEVVKNLKRDIRLLQNRIKDLDRTCNRSLEGSERQQWQKEWTEKDFEVFSSVLFVMADMSEEQRNIAEEFMNELKAGNIKVEAA